MKKFLLLFVLIPQLLLAQIPHGFQIEGKLDGYPDGTDVRLIKNGESVEMTSAKLQKGKFVLKGSVDEPVLCFVMIGQEKPVELYVENTNISFKLKSSNPPVFEVEGSSSHRDFLDFTKSFVPVAQQLNAMAQQVNMEVPGPARDSLMVTFNQLQTNLQAEIDRFVNTKPKSLVTPFLLNVTYQFNEDVVMLENRFNKLDPKVRKSIVGKELQEFIGDKKIGAIGTQALDFSQPDTLGNMVSLSSFRGKYVLVDFWASWCGPCRNENPNVVENFNHFKDKNFTVLGVSLDRPGQKAKWLGAIYEDGLTWTHVSDLQFWNNAVAKMYRINSIPQNLLLDPQGKIIGKNLRGPALEAKLCELLGCN